MDQPKPVRMYDPRIMQVYERKIKRNKEPTYIPIADGFITTSGNAERGTKWGNSPSVLGTSTAPTMGTTMTTTTAMLNKKTE